MMMSELKLLTKRQKTGLENETSGGLFSRRPSSVIAAWQIASSTEFVLAQVRFPKIFAKLTGLFGLFGFALFDVGGFKCAFRWSYFEQLAFVTLAPFGIVVLGAGAYQLIQRRRGKTATAEDRRRNSNNIMYATLLFLYIVLPNICSYVITYFSCSRFDRGKQRDLKVIAAELSIKCTSRRYQRWAVYDGLMIAIWPVGATLSIAALLWRHRAQLDPKVPELAQKQRQLTDAAADLFQQKQDLRRFFRSMDELQKIKIRNKDESIAGLEFLYEEYEPRCYLFPVFEIVRRLFLSSVLAVFYPRSMQQVVVGLLGAMGSYVVYSHYEAFIEDNDDVVSTVAAGQLVLIYFGALAVYASDVSDQKRDDTYSGTAFGVILALILLSSFAVAACVTLLEVFGFSSLSDAYNQVLARASCVESGGAAGADDGQEEEEEEEDDNDDDDDEQPTPQAEEDVSSSEVDPELALPPRKWAIALEMVEKSSTPPDDAAEMTRADSTDG